MFTGLVCVFLRLLAWIKALVTLFYGNAMKNRRGGQMGVISKHLFVPAAYHAASSKYCAPTPKYCADPVEYSFAVAKYHAGLAEYCFFQQNIVLL
jgi:hypothetical protein